MRVALQKCALLAVLQALAFWPFSAHAGAWTQNKGTGLAILNTYYYTADEMWNNSGSRTSQPDYVKYELNPYLEYGLEDYLTIGGSLSLQRAAQDIPGGGENTNYSLGDSEFFGRARLYQQDGFVLSSTALVKLPSPESAGNTPKIGGRHPDLGFGFSAGYGFGDETYARFVNLDTLYRFRFGAPKDQVNIAATLGWSVSPKWMLMPQMFLTYRMDKPSVAAFTQSSGDDYNLAKLQLSALYHYDNDTSFQFGAFADVDGKNTGVGRGLLLSIWRDF